MGDQSYTLASLAELTGTEPRTIRSYIERGLLPSPSSRGRGASYDQEHLDRLKVIQLLRDAHRDLTLDQVRVLLARLTPDIISGLARGHIQIGAVIDSDALNRPATSALDYLRNIQRPSSTARSLRQAMRAPPTDTTALPALDRLVDLLRPISNAAPTRQVKSEVWHRVQITPDIELSVRGPLSEEQLATVHRLGDQLRQLITKGPSDDRKPPAF